MTAFILPIQGHEPCYWTGVCFLVSPFHKSILINSAELDIVVYICFRHPHFPNLDTGPLIYLCGGHPSQSHTIMKITIKFHLRYSIRMRRQRSHVEDNL